MRFITRRIARLCALQALYSWQLSKNSCLEEIENYIVFINNIQDYNFSYFHKLYVGVISCITDLNKLMAPYIFRDLQSIDYVEYSVLLIALFELTRCSDIPYKVVIDEAIELVKIFGSQRSHKFINGVLDKIVTKNIDVIYKF